LPVIRFSGAGTRRKATTLHEVSHFIRILLISPIAEMQGKSEGMPITGPGTMRAKYGQWSNKKGFW
jgi:hypothetical protein